MIVKLNTDVTHFRVNGTFPAIAAVVVLLWGGAADAARAVSYGPERVLAGVAIGRPAIQVLRKYGNPTRIESKLFTPPADQAGSSTGSPEGGLPSAAAFGLPAAPGMPTPESIPPPAPGGNLSGALGGLFGPQPATPGASLNAFNPFGGVGTQQPTVSPRALTKYYYDYATGPSLVFTVGQKGLVEQIDAFAPWPWSPAKTSRGINVGASYKQVISQYGFPNDQRTNSDGTLLMDYRDKTHCAFTLLLGRVVGVSVALVE